MESKADLKISIESQPDDTTCGPTALHAVYNYYGLNISLKETIDEIKQLKDGGTLVVLLAVHALRKGFRAKIYTYNLQVFDLTWFTHSNIDIGEKLKQQLKVKPESERLKFATEGYLEFLRLGGEIRQEPLSNSLIRRYLNKNIPILTGLSATYLYNEPREFGSNCEFDDIRGFPSGHFVVLSGYNKDEKKVKIADPYKSNPYGSTNYYSVGFDRLINSILLGILTFDANLLIIEPGR
ncbi:MAG: C39 family peptidase [Leptospira sp.]|nr:C39 family peptidase [Leptospira sp.]